MVNEAVELGSVEFSIENNVFIKDLAKDENNKSPYISLGYLFLNSLPISMDDVEVFYNGGIDRMDNKRMFMPVDFLDPCIMADTGSDGILLHDGYMEDEEIEKKAILN